WDSANGCGHTARGFCSSTSAAPPNQATSLESQTIHKIQLLSGQTLKEIDGRNCFGADKRDIEKKVGRQKRQK
ncbi:MAG TPA: hypothetical protein VHY35_12435, partial [Stellaceae bacterium]|nr:hypothetical protein [Stellaceae bacterium]